MLTGNPGASARDAGDTVVEIVTAMLRLDELLPRPAAYAKLLKRLGVPDEKGANNNRQIVANKPPKTYKSCLKVPNRIV